ncbi:hypothetical protein [Latilactobacillus sakei]|nr:hypothetical protein [Latilactobacillus sakei]
MYTNEKYKVTVSEDGLSFTFDTSQIDQDVLPTNVIFTEHNGDQVSKETTLLVMPKG